MQFPQNKQTIQHPFPTRLTLVLGVLKNWICFHSVADSHKWPTWMNGSTRGRKEQRTWINLHLNIDGKANYSSLKNKWSLSKWLAWRACASINSTSRNHINQSTLNHLESGQAWTFWTKRKTLVFCRQSLCTHAHKNPAAKRMPKEIGKRTNSWEHAVSSHALRKVRSEKNMKFWREILTKKNE